jgi:hypothetical protein
MQTLCENATNYVLALSVLQPTFTLNLFQTFEK